MVLSKKNLDSTVFYTSLAVVEAILNRRPITHVSTDPRDIEELSPADVLYPGVRRHSSVNILPPAMITGEEYNSSWKRVRTISETWWCRWRDDYVQSLKERQKWSNSQKNLEINELVLLVDENQPRDVWRIARITDVRSDGTHTRSAIVKLPNGKLFERDVSKIVRLELGV